MFSRKAFTMLLIAVLTLMPVMAQNPQQPQPLTATTLSFLLLNPPVPLPSLNIATNGAPGPSSSTKYYWLVSNFPIGNSSPSGPFQAFNVPATLSGSNYEILNWPSVASATSYDVLKTSTPSPPTGACACAVVIGTSALTVNDQSNSTLGYTVNTLDPTSLIVQLDDESFGAGTSELHLTQRGSPFGFPNAFYVIPPSRCAMFATVGAFAANDAGTGGLAIPAVTRVAANNWVLQGITTAAANSLAVKCDIDPPTPSTPGHGSKITAIQIFYGVQTTDLTSITTPSFATITYPATGGAAAGTVGSAGGSLTITPAVLQLVQTASGSCYSEHIVFGTPPVLSNTLQRLTFEQIFNQSAAAATQLQFCGAVVFYTDFPL